MIMPIVLALGLLWLIGASSQTLPSSPQTTQVATFPTAEQRLERTFITQQRINRYFHGEVIPKLKNCWNGVKGRGSIEIEHTYRKDASGKWIAGKLNVAKSSLPRGQDAVALQCMQESVRATSFPVEGGDGQVSSYTVNWTWPVPFPVNATSLTRAMFAAKPKGGGGLGCDGEGSPAKCVTCSAKSCAKVCVGYKDCWVAYSGGRLQSCQTKDACASGGPFGVAGGSTIY